MKPFGLSKQNPKLFKKLEQMKEQNFKSQAREATYNWRKHVPVYGWVQINYPTGIKPSLREKYAEEEEQKRLLLEEKKKLENEEEKKEENNVEEVKLPNINQIPMKKNKARVNPEKVNEDVLKELEEIEKVMGIGSSDNFLTNYPKNDFKFLKKQFRDFELKKRKIEDDVNAPQNFNKIIKEGENKFLYQLGIKNAETYLTTLDYEKKCEHVNMNLLIDEKYCTMFPKSAMLGPKPDKNFENPTKKIGDISFEEEKGEIESVKNLSRLPPENITEEWVKDNLKENVEKINFENCYWLSKDLISKLGRLDKNLKKISLRNLDLSNYIVENIIKYTKNLEELDLSNCTGLKNGLLEIISEKGTNLKSLNLFNVSEAINDAGLINMGYKLQNLKSINLGRNYDITDKGIKGLLCHGIKLNKLELTGNTKLTNEGIKNIFEFCSESLEDLTLNFLPKITDEGLADLKKCKNLKNVEIMGLNPACNTGDALSGLNKLITVNISGCSKVNDSNVNDIINGNSNSIRILRVSNCPLLTDNILNNLNEKNTSLLVLEINRTKNITDAKINETVENHKPNLRIIRATNMEWSKKNLGLTVPYPSDNYVKPVIKGAKKAQKKNDDKSPEAQLIKLREEMRPKMIFEFFKQEDKVKKKGKKKK